MDKATKRLILGMALACGLLLLIVLICALWAQGLLDCVPVEVRPPWKDTCAAWNVPAHNLPGVLVGMAAQWAGQLVTSAQQNGSTNLHPLPGAWRAHQPRPAFPDRLFTCDEQGDEDTDKTGDINPSAQDARLMSNAQSAYLSEDAQTGDRLT